MCCGYVSGTLDTVVYVLLSQLLAAFLCSIMIQLLSSVTGCATNFLRMADKFLQEPPE